jgi:hypothetical protein
MDLYYCGEEDDVYIFLIGPSKQIPEIPYPRNSAWLPRGLRVKGLLKLEFKSLLITYKY